MSTKKPNVVFILSDQHSSKALGINGRSCAITPNLDRMVKSGVSFENAICQNPICTPSRVSWLSGQYCHNHGYYGLSGPNPQGLPTILGHFRRGGYRSGAVGKIHCPEYWLEDDCDLFIEARGLSIGGSPEYGKYLKEKGYASDPDNEFANEFGQCLDGAPSKMSYQDSQEKFIVENTKQFITQSVADGKPFIVHTSFGKPHQPYAPAPEFWALYDDVDLTLPPNFEHEKKAGKAPHLIEHAKFYQESPWTVFEPRDNKAGALRKLQGYLGCVSQVDHAVGELIAWLEQQGLAEDTIVVYSTDHGDHMCEHGLMEKAPGICSDSITRIPYIWYWKGKINPRGTVPEIIETVDLSQTLCSLCGLEEMETSDGKDFSSLLFGDAGPIREIGVTEFPLSKSIRKGKYRYVHYTRDFFAKDYPGGFGELYDLEEDPGEMNNLYFDNDYSEVISGLKDDLFDWLLTTNRPKTVLGLPELYGSQYISRYHCTVNHDGKVHPKYIPRSGRYS